MRKGDRVSRAAKRTGSQKARNKVRHTARQGSVRQGSVRQGSARQVKAKASRGSRKPARRVTAFKSTSWYQIAAQSIGISPRAAP
jgi:hypothetical protein